MKNKRTIRRNGKRPVYARIAYVAPGVWFILPKTGERMVALGQLDGVHGNHHALYNDNVILLLHGNTEVLVPAAVG